MTTTFQGSCHCGNVRVGFETARDPADIPVRECQCGFCRRHGARAITDPKGTVFLRIDDPARVSHYQFALRTADFLVCATCGVWMAAVMRDDTGAYATLNLNVLDDAARFTQPPAPVDYSAEDASGRIERRRERWTPLRDVS